MEENDERHNLYMRFIKSEIERKTEDFFDEEELVEIFDYASDLNDDFAKIEVLLYAARICPDSEALRVRRAYFYAMLGNDTAADMINRQTGEQSVLSRILAITLSSTGNKEADKDALLGIVDSVEDFEDEEIIQFVGAAVRLGLYGWLKENRDYVGAKCSYKPTFYYELASVAEENNDEPYAVKMFEELTMLDAFNLDFWHRLAEAHLILSDFSQAVQAADYALAIDPTDLQSMKLKARALSQLHSNPDEVIKLYDKVLASDLMEEQDYGPLTAAYISVNNEEKAVKMLEASCAREGSNLAALDTLMIMSPSKARKFIDKALDINEITEESVMEWSRQHTDRGDYFGAAEIVKSYLSRGGVLSDPAIPMEIFYATNDYDSVVKIYEGMCKAPVAGEYVCRPGIILPVIMSYFRTGRSSVASKIAQTALEYAVRADRKAPLTTLARIYRCPVSSARVISTGLVATLHELCEFLEHPHDSNSIFNSADPLSDFRPGIEPGFNPFAPLS
mgnify:CR=1 FL=1